MSTNLEPNPVGTSADPDVLGQPKRRRFGREKKMEILDEIDRTPDQTGLILTEGITVDEGELLVNHSFVEMASIKR
jgi:hypothetical protein